METSERTIARGAVKLGVETCVERRLILCSVVSLDGYSTIDQREKDCRYKTSDGSADLTEREPLKVRFS